MTSRVLQTSLRCSRSLSTSSSCTRAILGNGTILSNGTGLSSSSTSVGNGRIYSGSSTVRINHGQRWFSSNKDDSFVTKRGPMIGRAPAAPSNKKIDADDDDSFPFEEKDQKKQVDYKALQEKAKKDFEISAKQMNDFLAKTEPIGVGENGAAKVSPNTLSATSAVSSSALPTLSAATSIPTTGGAPPTTRTIMKDQQKILFPRLGEATDDKEFEEDFSTENTEMSVEKMGNTQEKMVDPTNKKEIGFKYAGKEPTSYGDWSHKGRVTDF